MVIRESPRFQLGSPCVPRKTTPVASILVTVVPSRLASGPPTSGVHVLFKENAEMRRENSVLSVPISRDKRDLSGPRIYDALCLRFKAEL